MAKNIVILYVYINNTIYFSEFAKVSVLSDLTSTIWADFTKD